MTTLGWVAIVFGILLFLGSSTVRTVVLVLAMAFGVLWGISSIPWSTGFGFIFSSGATILEFLLGLFSAFFFWPVVLLGLVVLLYLEKEIWGTLLFAGAFAGFWWVTKMDVSSFDWARMAWILGFYLVIGFAFTFAKLWFHSKKTAKAFFSHVEQLLKDSPSMSKDGILRRWTQYGVTRITFLEDQNSWDFGFHPGKLAASIILWVAYWPMYLTIIVFEDFVKEVADWVVVHFGGVYKSIIQKAFSHVEQSRVAG